MGIATREPSAEKSDDDQHDGRDDEDQLSQSIWSVNLQKSIWPVLQESLWSALWKSLWPDQQPSLPLSRLHPTKCNSNFCQPELPSNLLQLQSLQSISSFTSITLVFLSK